MIVKKLIKNRNAIAHGDRISDAELEDSYQEIKKELLDMIQTFHNMVKNAASNNEYLK